MTPAPLSLRNRAFLLAAAAYVALIYATDGLMPVVLGEVRRLLGSDYSPGLSAMVGAGAVAFVLAYRRRLWPLGRGRAALLVAVGLGYALAVRALDIPEERYHLLEYGLLSVLLTEGLAGRLPAASWHACVLALVMAAGAVDEAVQWALPNRVGDPRDVLLNWIAAVLAQAALATTLWGRGVPAPAAPTPPPEAP